MAIGQVVAGHDELTRVSPEIATAPFIHDLLKPLGLSEVVGVVLRRDPGCLITLSALYDGASATLESQLRQVIGTFTPHVTRAIQYAERLTERSRLAAIAGDASQVAVIVIDAGLRVVTANAPAASLITAGDELRVTGGLLSLREPASQERLLAVISGDKAEEAICLGSPPRTTMVMSVRRVTGAERLLYRLIIIDSAEEGRWTGRILENAYGLTAAEAKLAALVGRGLSPAQAAASLGVAVSTVRTQLLRVFGKTGVRRQTDLVRLVTRLAALAAPP